jgi:hypothetical protein
MTILKHVLWKSCVPPCLPASKLYTPASYREITATSLLINIGLTFKHIKLSYSEPMCGVMFGMGFAL